MVELDLEIVTAEARTAMLQGHIVPASVVTTNSESAAAEAELLLPQGHRPFASAAVINSEIDGAASGKLLRGHRVRAATAEHISPDAAKNGMPRGPSGVAEIGADQIAAGAANGTLPEGQPADAAPASTQIVEGEAIDGEPQGHAGGAPLDELCGRLMSLQRDRIFAIRMQSRCDRAVEAYIRTRIGFTTDPTRMGDAERKKLAAEARRLKRSVEHGEDQVLVADKVNIAVIQACSAVILRNMSARGMWDEMRAGTQKEMEALAKQLPAWEFVKSIKGVSELGLAVIVGEAGNLGDYPKKGHLWKRLGLAVIDGKRQGNPGAGASAEDWIKHGYKAARRAEVYAFIDDVMFRSQWRGAKDGQPGYPIGPYGAHYGRKKAEYLVRFADEPHAKAHAENAARRYMAKMFIRDLWKAWRGARSTVPEGQQASAPATLTEAAA